MCTIEETVLGLSQGISLVHCRTSIIVSNLHYHVQSTLRPTLYLKTGNYIHNGNTTQIYTERVTAQPQRHAHYLYGVHVVYIVALSLNIAAVWIFSVFKAS